MDDKDLHERLYTASRDGEDTLVRELLESMDKIFI